MRRWRIFVGLLEVAGYFGRLTKALNEIGMPADYFGLYDGHFYRWRERSGANRGLERVLRKTYENIDYASRCLDRILLRLRFRCALALFFLACVPRYDAFIFSAGASFFSGIELWLLRLLGKKILFVYLGSESRPPYLNGIFLSSPQWKGYRHLLNYTREISSRVRRQERVAHAVISHRESAQFLRNPFYDYLSVGYPVELRTAEPEAERRRGGLRIVHAPSLPQIKGTPRIREMVEACSRIHSLEYVELVGKTNAEVLEQLRNCDFVIDELYSDSPLGGLAAEGASFGKPTLVSGYAQRMLPGEEGALRRWPPSEYCHPKELEERFLRLVQDAEYRRLLGADARAFLETQWLPRCVARRVVRIIGGNAPADWLACPRKVRYFHGYGIEEEALRVRLREFIDKFGENALMLSHNPALRTMIRDFAAGEGSRCE